MTVSREKRSQRKKNIVLKFVNRISRINIIKMVKNLAGDGIHLPVYVEQKHIVREVEPAQEKVDKFVEVDKEVMVTPYGTFSKYKQETLLDHYETKQEHIENIKPLDSKDMEAAVDTVEVVDVKIVLSKLQTRIISFVLATLKIIGRFVKFLGEQSSKSIEFGFDKIGKGLSIVSHKAGTRIPERFKLANLGNSAFTLKFIEFIDLLDDKFGILEEKLDIVEGKIQSILGKVWIKRLGIYRVLHINAKYLNTKILILKSRVLSAYEKGIEFTHANPRKVFIASCGILAFLITTSLFVGSITAYEYLYNGKVLGVVKNQNDVFVTVDVIGDKLTKAYKANIVIDKEKNISFKKVIGLNLKLDSREDVLNSFTYLKDMEVQAYAIVVDGKQIAILDNKQNVEALLSTIQKKYLKDSKKIKYNSIGFAQDVQIKEVNTKIGNLQDKSKVIDFMLTGALEKKIHAVQKGETFSGIASNYGVKQAQLMASNPGIIPDKLKIGQEIVMTAAAPVLTVQTSETAEYVEAIPFKIQYENTAAKYKGEQSVKSRGESGQKKVVAKIIRNNGIEVSRTEVSSKITLEPQAQIVLVGTKNPPPLVGTGRFISPVRGTITSGFGYRWGRLHTGVDIGVHTGTTVKAADGGTVIFSGRDGSLGICIRIDHGGNRVTTYGHLSKTLVKRGQKVFQGQHIANSGNTGHSTGPHLHFEVKINGVFKNPLNYI
ncbi:MAG: M23 family metallopeptidase [Eubacteriales bacterium]